MKSPSPKFTALKPTAFALAFGLALAGVALAQTAPTPAQQKELDAARADLEKAAQRMAELHRRYGGAEGPMRIEKRVVRKPVIGVLLAPDPAAGVRIAGVTPDSAAAAAGLKSGDRLVSIDGKAIVAADGAARVEQARAILGAVDATTPVRLAYERDGKASVVSVTPKVGDRLLFMPGAEGAALMGDFPGDIRVIELHARDAAADATTAAGAARKVEIHARTAAGDARRHAEWSAAVAPDVRREIIRLGSDCKGDDCKLPALAEAFRWNGLNLASVDARLGRYFGTTEGVLVLSTGKDLAGLQPGDVIRKIGGKPVGTPRAAMEALRAQPANSKVAVEYLRDRVVGTAQVSVPKALPFKMAMAPHAALPRSASFTSTAPNAPGAVHKRRFVLVEKDGKTRSWEGDAGEAPPAWVQSLPKDGKHVEKRRVVTIDKDGKRVERDDDASAPLPAADGTRVEKRLQVFVDADGKTIVLEDDDLPPPPAPPAAPPPPKRD